MRCHGCRGGGKFSLIALVLACVIGLVVLMAVPHFAQHEPSRPLGPGATLEGKRFFPDDNPWNQDISREPVGFRGGQDGADFPEIVNDLGDLFQPFFLRKSPK